MGRQRRLGLSSTVSDLIASGKTDHRSGILLRVGSRHSGLEELQERLHADRAGYRRDAGAGRRQCHERRRRRRSRAPGTDPWQDPEASSYRRSKTPSASCARFAGNCESCRRAARGRDLRTRPAFDEILAAIEPHLLSFGITRVGELTGLDVIGIPVFSASRPNSRSLSVCQGKGRVRQGTHGWRHHGGRRAGAGRAARGSRHRNGRARTRWRRAGLTCMLFHLDASVRTRRAMTVVASAHGSPACRWSSGRQVHVPFELVGFDLRDGTQWDHAQLHDDHGRIGRRASLAEAALHALLEVVENDASALSTSSASLPGSRDRSRIAPVAALHWMASMAKVESAGLGCFFVDLTGHVALPTVAAFVTQPSETHAGSGARSFAGFACRLSAEEAAIAALLEAVQSRLTQIAGARDDLSPEDYLPKRAPISQVAGAPQISRRASAA